MKSTLLILGLVLVMPAIAGSQGDRGPPADVLAVRNVEVTFHTAGSVLPEKSLDLMMSIYTDDAVLTDTAHDNKVYRGKAARRCSSVTAWRIWSEPAVTWRCGAGRCLTRSSPPIPGRRGYCLVLCARRR